MDKVKVQNKANFIWKIANELRGAYKLHEFGDIILPFTLLVRLDAVLLPTKKKVLAAYELNPKDTQALNIAAAPLSFYNTSKFLTLQEVKSSPKNLLSNLQNYMQGFNKDVADIFEKLKFNANLHKLEEKGLLWKIFTEFVENEDEFSPESITNEDMGAIYEELIRRFSEQENETAGEHFTPRDVITLMAKLIFEIDKKVLTKPNTIKSLYDPACGTGGMLSIAEQVFKDISKNTSLSIHVAGQEINDSTYAICKADMILKGQKYKDIHLGNTLTKENEDLKGRKFDYMMSNPPFGVSWNPEDIQSELELGHAGRFGAGIPRKSDGSFLFLQHMISKMKNTSHIAIVFNGAPLSNGDAGSGESSIRQWLIESDLVDTIIGLPSSLFYNTDIASFIWLLSAKKEKKRKGKIQLIDATQYYVKLLTSLGKKKNIITEKQIEEICTLYRNCEDNDNSIIKENKFFGYTQITIEQPLKIDILLTQNKVTELLNHKELLQLKNSKKEEDPQIYIALKDYLASLLNQQYNGYSSFKEDLLSYFGKLSLKVNNKTIDTIIKTLGEVSEQGEILYSSNGKIVLDMDLKDTENVPFTQNIDSYIKDNILVNVPDAIYDPKKNKVGYQIPFSSLFYKPIELRSATEIKEELQLEFAKIKELVKELGLME